MHAQMKELDKRNTQRATRNTQHETHTHTCTIMHDSDGGEYVLHVHHFFWLSFSVLFFPRRLCSRAGGCATTITSDDLNEEENEDDVGARVMSEMRAGNLYNEDPLEVGTNPPRPCQLTRRVVAVSKLNSADP